MSQRFWVWTLVGAITVTTVCSDETLSQSASQQLAEVTLEFGRLNYLGQTERDSLRKLSDRVRIAETQRDTKQRELTQAKKRSEQDAAAAPSLIAAKEQVNELRQQMTSAKARAVEALRKQPKYSQLCQDRVAARAQLKLDKPETRPLTAKTIAELETKIRRAEDESLANDKSATKLKESLASAEKKLAEENRKRRRTIEQDKRVQLAKTNFDKARDELKSVQHELAEAAARITQIQNRMRLLASAGQSLEGNAQREMQNEGYRQASQSGRSGIYSCSRCGATGNTFAINSRCPGCGALFVGMKSR